MNNNQIIETFFLDFQDLVDSFDESLVSLQLPSSVIAIKNKLVKIKYFAVDTLITTSFLESPELTQKSPYLTQKIASYVPFNRCATSFQDFYSINSNVTKLTFRLHSGGEYVSFVNPINAFLVLEIFSV
jgi:hypothetical protein